MMDAAGGQLAIALEPESSSPLIDLLPELWGKILNKIDQKDALNLRLVNKDFMDKVNNLYENWKIKLDESSPYLEMILDLRVKEVEVHRLLNTPSFRPPGILFKYPDLIQKLTFGASSLSTQNAHVLLQSKNLKWIRQCLYVFKPVEALGPFGYNLLDLRTLEIYIYTSEEDEGQFLEPGNLFQQLMMSSTMPKLKSFKFLHGSHHNNSDMIYNCISVLLSFLSRQGQNLQHFVYTSWIPQNHSFAEFPPLDDSIVLKNMTSLKTLKLHYNCNVDPLDKTWRRLIQNQKNLVELELGSRFSISSTFLKEIVANNFQTLTSVEINCWPFEEGQTYEVFNASIFQACHSLTSLKVIPDNRSISMAVYLFSLPTQIKALYLSDFWVHSGDILNFLLGHSVLSFLSIRSGVNLSVLEAILAHPALLIVHIGRGIGMPTSPLDLARLNEIFDMLKCRRNFDGQFNFNNEFRIKRPSVSADWEKDT